MFRRACAAIVAGAVVLSGLTLTAAPASATGEAFSSLSPSAATASETVTLTAVVTLDTNATSGGLATRAGYYITLPGFNFSGLTCANVTSEPSLGADADTGPLTGACLGFSASRGGLNLASSYITGTPNRQYTITITGLRAPSLAGTYNVGLANWDASQTFATQPFEVTAPPGAFLVTIDIDSNGGTCATSRITGFSTTWANAPSATDCAKSGVRFREFNTLPDGSGLAIAAGGNLQLTGDNRLYAIYESPRTSPGVPTDVVATPGRNSVKVTWKAPVSDGGDPINSYCIALRTEQNPNPFPRCSNSSEPLERTVERPATNSKYTFSVFARNSQGSSELAVSAPVSPYDIKGVTASRKDVLLGLGGTQVEARGDAPGLAGQSLTVEYKVGAAQWTTQANAVSVDVNSNFRWSKKFPRSSNKNAVTVRFSYGTDAVVGPFVLTRGGEAGDLSAPRNIKVDNRPNKIKVTWDRPKFDGGATITGYTLCATPGAGIGGRICRSETGTEGIFWNLNTRQTYTFTVSAKTTTREGPRGKYAKPVDPTDASIRSAARSFDELTADVRGAGFKKNSRFRVEVAATVPGVNPDRWDWDQVTSFREDQESFTRSLRIPLDASLRGERLMLRLITPEGTVYSRSIRP